jgi:hypothetical protein
MNQNDILFEPRHLGVPSDVSKTISEPMVHLAQNVQLSCTETNTISKRIEMRFYMTKTISKAMVYSTQTVHLSWIKISTIYKQAEKGIHLSLVT